MQSPGSEYSVKSLFIYSPPRILCGFACSAPRLHHRWPQLAWLNNTFKTAASGLHAAPIQHSNQPRACASQISSSSSPIFLSPTAPPRHRAMGIFDMWRRGWRDARAATDRDEQPDASAAPPPIRTGSVDALMHTTFMQGLPQPKAWVVEDACSGDEESYTCAYNTLLEDATSAVRMGTADALQWVRAAQARTL